MNKTKPRAPSLPRILSSCSSTKKDEILNRSQSSSTLPKTNRSKSPPGYYPNKDFPPDNPEMSRTYTVTDGLSDLMKKIKIERKGSSKVPNNNISDMKDTEQLNASADILPKVGHCGSISPLNSRPWSNKLPLISKKSKASPSPDSWSRSHFDLQKYKETLQHEF